MSQLTLALSAQASLGTDLPHNGAVISDDELYRYVLTRTWDASLPSLVFCLLNPSTADAATDDNTSRKCKGFARRLGHGGITIVNLFAYRTKLPSDLRKKAHEIDVVGPDNDRWLRRVFSAGTKTVVCGWGGDVPNVQRVGRVVAIANECGAILYALGTTTSGARAGQPRHPRTTPYRTPMTEWRP